MNIENFVKRWKNKGDEKSDCQRFWIDLLESVFDVENATEHIEFEKRVTLGHKSFIDAFIPETRVLIEQKSIDVDLGKKKKQSDGTELTPYEQGKRYNDWLDGDERAKYIIACNFKEFWIYDVDKPNGEPVKIKLENLPKEYKKLAFIVKPEEKTLSHEIEISVKAGELVGKMYDALRKQYVNPDSEEALRSLNVLCVRIVFCLYAEDADVFPEHNQFYTYMQQFQPQHFRKALIDLFRILDQKEDERDPYTEAELAAFPYVNGGLFAEENIEIPNFTHEIRHIILNEMSLGFDWSEISPTIFGAVFESTLNPETRRSGGMHYTSIENIHKVIDPLFLDDLKEEFRAIKAVKAEKTRRRKLKDFRNKLASLVFLDPACGSGNFLTETYLSLRRLENAALMEETHGQMLLADDELIKVSISQFYGIEINDFAVTVAKTALWIAESQMMKVTENIMQVEIDFLPLKTNAFITEGNALRINWEDIVPKDRLNFIMGNPPFVGYSLQSDGQKSDIRSIYVDNGGKPYKSAGKIDYVAAWYFKASQFMLGTEIKTAFVSTNSITQGEQVAGVFKPLYERFHIHIDFAYRTFRWDSEASIKAHVHVIIIGFSIAENKKDKILFDGDKKEKCKNINFYLLNADNVFIESRKEPICNVPKMETGNRPADGGHLIIESNEYKDFIEKEPNAKKYIKKLTGATEYINNKKRYCLWLVNISPSELRKMPEVMKRVEACRQDRLNGAPDRQKLADTPTLFREIKNPKTFIIVPRVSSENRIYIPIGFLNDNIIPTDSATIIPNAQIYHFGILTSSVHMAWMRAVCGRLKSDYRYSKDIVYNNFPWCKPTDKQKAKIEETAQKILDARELYPDSSLADLYNETTMPPELRKAHRENDRAVIAAYGFDKDITEPEIVAKLMSMYEKLTENL